MKSKKHRHNIVSLSWVKVLKHFAQYRRPMRVREVMVYPTQYFGETGYYVCPRCHVTMEREYMAFCDRCGQHLNWHGCQNAKIVYPGRNKNVQF